MHTKCFTSEMFFLCVCAGQILFILACMLQRKLCSFIPSLTLSMETEVIVLEKVWEKFCSLYPKICMNPVLTQPVAYFSD